VKAPEGVRLQPDFVARASTDAIRTQYQHAQAQSDLWADRARELFLLLCQRDALDTA
jgi:hypothetical protein